MVAACEDENQARCLADAQERCSEESQKRYKGAKELFTDGKFPEAANMGEAINTSESLALAAEALALDGQYHERDDKQTQFQRGKDLAARAIALNPCNSEAHFRIDGGAQHVQRFDIAIIGPVPESGIAHAKFVALIDERRAP